MSVMLIVGVQVIVGVMLIMFVQVIVGVMMIVGVQVGRSLAVSALDLSQSNPWSRVTLSEHCHLSGVREWLRKYLHCQRAGHRPSKNVNLRLSNNNK